MDNLALAGLIDPVDNLKNDNVYIFQGKIDSVVPASKIMNLPSTKIFFTSEYN